MRKVLLTAQRIAIFCLLPLCCQNALAFSELLRPSLRATPTIPDGTQAVVLEITDSPGVATNVDSSSVTVSGFSINISATLSMGIFDVYAGYYIDKDVGVLAPGTYVVTYTASDRIGFQEGPYSVPHVYGTWNLVVTAKPPAIAVEYYNATLDHYFMTASPDEIALLDEGRFVGWARTGESFGVFAGGTGNLHTSPVCRYYGRPERGLDTHFYSVLPEECEQVLVLFPNDWVLESSDVFEVFPPSREQGDCWPGSIPVYRLYNNRPDANHRYTTSLQIVQEMVAKGWVPEGYGPKSVGMCVMPN